VSLPPHLDELLHGMLEHRRIALARAITVVENERPDFQALLHALLIRGRVGGMRVGVTGPPGAGKSSLVSAFAHLCRKEDEEVGIVAVDPTSPYSGGALLGDRIRMNDLATDPGIFIRSMASRGSLGGLATTTKEVVDVMDAYGFPRILIETVGVGQTELEVTRAADTVVVVLTPESGDGIQAMKAGLMEIADIFVVNKADRPGADRLVREIRMALKLRTGKAGGTAGHHGHHGAASSTQSVSRGHEEEAGRPDGDDAQDSLPSWEPPVLLTMAQSGDGVEALRATVDEHRGWLLESGQLEARRRDRMADRIREVLDREARRRVRRVLAAGGDTLDGALDRIGAGQGTPYSEATHFLRRLGMDPGDAPLPTADAAALPDDPQGAGSEGSSTTRDQSSHGAGDSR
jgi:LAO/AO transport system kinase